MARLTTASLAEYVKEQDKKLDAMAKLLERMVNHQNHVVGSPASDRAKAQERADSITKQEAKEANTPVLSDNIDDLMEYIGDRQGLFVFLPTDALVENDNGDFSGADHRYWDHNRKQEYGKNCKEIALQEKLHGVPADQIICKLTMKVRSTENKKKYEAEREKQRAVTGHYRDLEKGIRAYGMKAIPV